ncbi:MAG: replicative DNA helicase [Chthonomonas sp.]|nr:replicative DNA helicase [Chthonomonas sp.]
MAIDPYLPPQNLEAEMCAIGSMLMSERALDEVLEILSEEDLYSPAHKEIFKAVRQLVLNQRAVDILTLTHELSERKSLGNVGGQDYLMQLVEAVPSPTNAPDYAAIVKDKSTERRLQQIGHEIVKIAQDPEQTSREKVDRSESMVFDLGRESMGQDLRPVQTFAKDFFTEVDNFFATGQPILGVPSKFHDLDNMTGGFYGSDFTIVAARPAMGKTSLVLNFALNVARAGKGNVAVFSLEMSGQQLVRRMLSMISGVSMSVLKQERLHDNDYHKLADACETLYGLPIYIDDNSDISAMEMMGKCRRLAQQGGLAMIVVDYLQLMRSSKRTENRVQEVSEIARELKRMAKTLNVPLLALSQLSRNVENRDDKRPQLSDIRESGSIEAEADLVMFIYRQAYYADKENNAERDWDPDEVQESEIIIAKHRNGPTGKVVLGFQPNYARFVNLKT